MPADHPPNEIEELDASLREFRETLAAHEAAKKRAIKAAVAALRAKLPPEFVAARSPYSATHLRTLAREHGIPPAKRGPAADLPTWRPSS